MYYNHRGGGGENKQSKYTIKTRLNIRIYGSSLPSLPKNGESDDVRWARIILSSAMTGVKGGGKDRRKPRSDKRSDFHILEILVLARLGLIAR